MKLVELLNTAAMADELGVKSIHRMIMYKVMCVTVYSHVLVSMCERASVCLCVSAFISVCVLQSLCQNCAVP